MSKAIHTIAVEYEQPACPTQHAWAKVPVEPTQSQRADLKAEIKALLKANNAVMVSHYMCTQTCKTWPKKPVAL